MTFSMYFKPIYVHYRKIMQNHRLAEVGRDLWRSSCPTAFLKQGHQEPVAWDHVQMAFEDLREADSTISLGYLCQCSENFTVKKCFLMLRRNLPHFNLCLLPLVLSLGTTEKSLDPSSLQLLFRSLYTLTRCPLSLLFSRLKNPSS